MGTGASPSLREGAAALESATRLRMARSDATIERCILLTVE